MKYYSKHRGRPRQHVTCTYPGCDRPHLAKGLCKMHYQNPNPTMRIRPPGRWRVIVCNGVGDISSETARVDRLVWGRCKVCRNWLILTSEARWKTPLIPPHHIHVDTALKPVSTPAQIKLFHKRRTKCSGSGLTPSTIDYQRSKWIPDGYPVRGRCSGCGKWRKIVHIRFGADGELLNCVVVKHVVPIDDRVEAALKKLERNLV